MVARGRARRGDKSWLPRKGAELGILVHCVVGTFNKYKARYAGEGTRRVTLTITWAAED